MADHWHEQAAALRELAGFARAGARRMLARVADQAARSAHEARFGCTPPPQPRKRTAHQTRGAGSGRALMFKCGAVVASCGLPIGLWRR